MSYSYRRLAVAQGEPQIDTRERKKVILKNTSIKSGKCLHLKKKLSKILC